MRILNSCLLLVTAGLCGSALADTTVLPTNPAGGLYDLGTFSAGSYLLTGSGIVDLVGDGSFRIQPDGTPETTVTTPGYPYFNPSGSYLADGNYGPGGANAKIGALMGTLNPAPASPADWFLIGYSDTVTLGSAGHIYAAVNDTYYPNDTGSFNVHVGTVPDGASCSTILLSLSFLGLMKRQLKR